MPASSVRAAGTCTIALFGTVILAWFLARRRGDGEQGTAEANGAAPEPAVEAVPDAAEPA